MSEFGTARSSASTARRPRKLGSRRRSWGTALALAVLAQLALAPAREASAAGDRRETTRIVYPADAFLHNGGRVIDVTKPPFNARGDGVADDTKALVAAMDFVADSLRGKQWPTNTASYII